MIYANNNVLEKCIKLRLSKNYITIIVILLYNYLQTVHIFINVMWSVNYSLIQPSDKTVDKLFYAFNTRTLPTTTKTKLNWQLTQGITLQSCWNFYVRVNSYPKILNVSSGEKLRCRKVERVLRSKSMHIIYLSFFYPFLGWVGIENWSSSILLFKVKWNWSVRY